MRKIVWLILVAALGAAGWFAWAVLTPTELSGPAFVMLRPGYSSHRIAAELKNAGIIRSEEAFVLWHYVHRKRSLKAGEYLFDKPSNIIDIQKRLRRGDVYFRTVVVPEGYTMFDIARAVEAAGLGPADDFLKVAQHDTALIADFAPEARSLEGYLFPDTYEFTRLMTMHDMAAAMVKQFRQVAHQISLIPATGDAKQARLRVVADPSPAPPEAAVSSDVERTVIMASIVEKETAVAEERPLVASVYFNRLAKTSPSTPTPASSTQNFWPGPTRARCTTRTCSSTPPTTPTEMPDFRPARLAILDAAPSKPPCILRKPTTIISLPTPKATTASPTPSKNTIRM